MENGEARLQGLIDETDAPSEKELEATRQELLAGATVKAPTWRMMVGGKQVVYDPDAIRDSRSILRSSVSIDLKMGLAEKIRRFLRSIFN
ncbi:hypothetical protein KKA33_02535 [Patescibacteria group bacterium]|nr:hypothetical protein [Patescibacteria group bacterium]